MSLPTTTKIYQQPLELKIWPKKLVTNMGRKEREMSIWPREGNSSPKENPSTCIL